MPDRSIDPIIEGVHFVNDVQTVISRQRDPHKFAVLTVGSFNAGTVANIIPDHAKLQLTLRSFDPETRKLLNDGVATTAKAVAMMAGAPAPEIVHAFGTSPVVNDPDLSARLAGLFATAFGADKVRLEPVSKPGGNGSEDYSEFVAAGMAKSVYFMVGGYDPQMIARYKAEGKPLPVNHSPFFAPVPEPSIRAGVEALSLAVLSVTSGH
jgi:hippurate hydrolase